MEIKVNIGGIDITISVKDAAEAAQAAQLITSLNSATILPAPPPLSPALEQKATADAPVVSAVIAAPAAAPEQLTGEVASDAPPHSRDAATKAIKALRGSRAAKILTILANNPKGVWDRQIKELVGGKSLAPQFSAISKGCAKAGTTIEGIMQRRRKFLGQGKVAYHYRLYDDMIATIKAMPDFEESREADLLYEEDDPLAGLGIDPADAFN